MTRLLPRLCLPLLLSLPATASSQLIDSVALGYSPRTGDVWVDARLGDINVYARGDLDTFVDDVVVSYGAPRYLVRELAYDRGWAPGDIQFACALARQLGRPCSEIASIYERDRGQGWGVIAQRLGIKPGSPAFHALKGNVGKSHDKLKARGKPAHVGKGKPTDVGQPGRDHDRPDAGQGKGKGKDKGRGG